MRDNASVEKSFEFAVRIVKLYKYLVNEHKEYVLSKQLLRCGTSIGANVAEAQRGAEQGGFYRQDEYCSERSKRNRILAEVAVQDRIFKSITI